MSHQHAERDPATHTCQAHTIVAIRHKCRDGLQCLGWADLARVHAVLLNQIRHFHERLLPLLGVLGLESLRTHDEPW